MSSISWFSDTLVNSDNTTEITTNSSRPIQSVRRPLICKSRSSIGVCTKKKQNSQRIETHCIPVENYNKNNPSEKSSESFKENINQKVYDQTPCDLLHSDDNRVVAQTGGLNSITVTMDVSAEKYKPQMKTISPDHHTMKTTEFISLPTVDGIRAESSYQGHTVTEETVCHEVYIDKPEREIVNTDLNSMSHDAQRLVLPDSMKTQPKKDVIKIIKKPRRKEKIDQKIFRNPKRNAPQTTEKENRNPSEKTGKKESVSANFVYQNLKQKGGTKSNKEIEKLKKRIGIDRKGRVKGGGSAKTALTGINNGSRVIGRDRRQVQRRRKMIELSRAMISEKNVEKYTSGISSLSKGVDIDLITELLLLNEKGVLPSRVTSFAERKSIDVTLNENSAFFNTDDEYTNFLFREFNFNNFRKGQLETIRSIVDGKKVLCILPTGTGKSLIYIFIARLIRWKLNGGTESDMHNNARESEIAEGCLSDINEDVNSGFNETQHENKDSKVPNGPSLKLTRELCLDGSHRVSIVVSPLISLMSDQILSFPNCIRAALVNSTMSPNEVDGVLLATRYGLIDLLLVAPERLLIYSFRSSLPPVGLVAIDEAHCVSEWSHSFRPAYQRLKTVIHKYLKPTHFVALTATATKRTIRSVMEQLGLDTIVRNDGVDDDVTNCSRPLAPVDTAETNEIDNIIRLPSFDPKKQLENAVTFGEKIKSIRDKLRMKQNVEMQEGGANFTKQDASNKIESLEGGSSLSLVDISDSVLHLPRERNKKSKLYTIGEKTMVVRSNLKLRAYMSNNPPQTLLDKLGELFNDARSANRRFPVIVYVNYQFQTEQISKLISSQLGVKAMGYHGGLPSYERGEIQEEFMQNRLQCIVATVAFGMGIDKQDIRGVIHLGIPKSIEGYVQETGRCARDGYRYGICISIVNHGDYVRMRKLVYSDTVDKSRVQNLFSCLLSYDNPSSPEISSVESSEKPRLYQNGIQGFSYLYHKGVKMCFLEQKKVAEYLEVTPEHLTSIIGFSQDISNGRDMSLHLSLPCFLRFRFFNKQPAEVMKRSKLLEYLFTSEESDFKENRGVYSVDVRVAYGSYPGPPSDLLNELYRCSKGEFSIERTGYSHIVVINSRNTSDSSKGDSLYIERILHILHDSQQHQLVKADACYLFTRTVCEIEESKQFHNSGEESNPGNTHSISEADMYGPHMIIQRYFTADADIGYTELLLSLNEGSIGGIRRLLGPEALVSSDQSSKDAFDFLYGNILSEEYWKDKNNQYNLDYPYIKSDVLGIHEDEPHLSAVVIAKILQGITSVGENSSKWRTQDVWDSHAGLPYEIVVAMARSVFVEIG